MASPLIFPMVIPPSTLSRWKSVGYDNLDENRDSHTYDFMAVPDSEPFFPPGVFNGARSDREGGDPGDPGLRMARQ